MKVFLSSNAANSSYFDLKKWAIGFLLIFTELFSVQAHEGNQAFYSLRVENGILILESKLEIPDLKMVVDSLKTCNGDQDFVWCAGTYIVDQISIRIDGKIHSLSFESSVTEDGHLIFTYSLGTLPSEFSVIHVENTAFISIIPHYENIIEINLSDQLEGYKMTTERTNITFKLNRK